MTNDEINKRVSEIEGYVPERRPGFPAGKFLWLHPEKSGHIDVPPYATDWAWCGPLVAKYEVELNICSSEEDKGPWEGWCIRSKQRGYADTPQRAICLAVIAAHEGK